MAALAVLSVMAVCLIERIAHSAVLQSANERFTSNRLDFRKGQSMAGLKLDDVLTDLEFTTDRGICRLINEAKNAEFLLGFDRGFRELVVYTPPGRGDVISLEPYTQTTDAINLQARGVAAGLRILGHGRRMHSSSPWEPVAEARKQDSLLRGSDLHSLRLPFWTAPPVLRHALTRSWVRLAKPTELVSSRWTIVSKPEFSQLLSWSQGDAHTMIEEGSSIASGLRDVRPLCEARLGRIRAA